VKRFSSAGWRVITCSRHSFPENCPWEAGPKITFRSISAIRQQVVARNLGNQKARIGGELHALVNNAGISPKGQGGKRMARSTRNAMIWQRCVSGEFLRTDHAGARPVEELQKRKGSVVNVTSIAGSRVHPFAGAAYATSKAALTSLTREMAPTSARAASASTRSRRAKSTPRSCRRAPTRSSSRSRCAASALPDEVAKIIYVLCTETSRLT
jgi:NAD(P)-dependent dehydrogenase (short-subunit alcohol dehydrogenase family)